MRKFISFISKFIAVLFSILFVATTVLILMFVNMQHTLLNPETHKRFLSENRVYEQLPALIAEQSASLERFLAEPCTDAPLVCAMGDAPLELQTCLTESLGGQAYTDIHSGQREPTAAELDSSQACLDQYELLKTETEAGSANDNPLSSAPAKVQDCARQSIGDAAFEALNNGQRPATKRETRQINSCIRQARREARLEHPGIGGDLMVILHDFSPAQWEELIRFLLPAADLQRTTESALEDAFSYLKGERDSASVSMVELKMRLMGTAGDELILLLLKAQPPCTEEQKAQINAGNFENGGATAIYCAASGETLAKVIPPMRNRLSRVASQIPDRVVIFKPPSASNGDKYGREPVTILRALFRSMRFIALMPLALLLLVAVFAVRSVKDLLRWWGIPLFIAGLIALGMALAAQPLLDWAWVNMVIENSPPFFSSGFRELGYVLSRSLVEELAKWIMLEAGLMALLGLAAILASRHTGAKLRATARSFTPPELSPDIQEVEAFVRSRKENDSGYS
jgi:hypothetical protein